MSSSEASPSLEHRDQSSERENAAQNERTPEQSQRTDRDEAHKSLGYIEERKRLRLVRGRQRAVLTRIFRRAEALLTDRATRPELESIRDDIDSAFEALEETNRSFETYLEEEGEMADAARYVADLRTEKQCFEDETDAYATGIRKEPQPGSTNLGARSRPMSQVSRSSAASRASAEAQISAKMKELRVRQLEREQKQERRRKKQEEELRNRVRQQDEELQNQRNLQKARDEAEAAGTESEQMNRKRTVHVVMNRNLP